MSETRKFIFAVVAIVVFIFVIFMATVDAQAFSIETTRTISLDQSTLQRGYTVVSDDKGFLLPIMPGQFDEPMTVKVETILDGSLLENNKTLISGQYIYDIKREVGGFLKVPVTIAMRYESSTDEAKSIYFYDRSQQKWRALPTKIDTKRKLAIAKTTFPYAEIIVAEHNPNPIIKKVSAPVAKVIVKEVVKEIVKQVEVAPVQTSFSDDLTAHSAIVIDNNGTIVFEKNSNEIRSVASLTKLITSEVFLENNPGWSKRIEIKESDNVGGASINFEPGDLVTVRDLFYATLVGSKNNAAMALARSTGMTHAQFVAEMNSMVESWGLENTHFVEPTGLNENNVSTAKEMMEISQRCFKNFDFLIATTTKWYEVKYIRDGEWKNYWVKNTNKRLLDRDLYITGSKTGYTHEAGYNLVTKAKTEKDSGRELIALVMGAKISQNYEEVYLLLKKFL